MYFAMFKIVFRQVIVEPLALLSRISLGIIFLTAGISKIYDLQSFYINVLNYNIIKGEIAYVFSMTLPFIEVILGIYLIFGIYKKITNSISLFLLLLFIYAISYAIITKQPVSGCGCFGALVREKISVWDIVRDVFFVLMNILSLTFDRIQMKKVRERFKKPEFSYRLNE